MIHQPDAELSDDSWDHDEAILLRFEAGWRDQQLPLLEEFIERESLEISYELLLELCKIDIEHRLRRGYEPSAAEYADRFSRLSDDESLAELDEFAGQIRSNLRSRPRMPQVGDEIRQYTVQSQIGDGAFSVVYSAWDNLFQRKVAVKVLRQGKADKPAVRERMRREALATASLRHPNVVPVYDTGAYGGLQFIVARFVDGQTLEAALGDRSFDLDVSVEIVRRLAGALEEAHQQGIVHRDLKPSNIMLEGDNPLLLDFGLAHVADATLQLTHEGDLLGTPAYMPPEQANGKGWLADPRSDIYSLGAILFRLVCDRLPFEGSIANVVHQVIHRECPDPSKFNSKVNRDLRTIMLKCLAKEPEDRYQSAQELSQDLQRYLAREPISARPLGPVTRAFRWGRRRPVMAGLVASTLLLTAFVVGTATQLQQVRQQRDRATHAESTAQDLMAKASVDAGLLALQRGRFAEATEHFARGLEREPENVTEILLPLVETKIASRQIAEAAANLKQAMDLQKESPQECDVATVARIALMRAELAMRGQSDCGNPLEQLDTAIQADQGFRKQYIRGLMADTTPEAVECFRRAGHEDPYHYSSRQMLAIALFSLARFQESLDEILVARQLFDDDEDFRLLEGLVRSALGDLPSALDLVGSTSLAPDSRENWEEFCQTVHHVTQSMHIDRGIMDLDLAAMKELVNRFEAEFQPLMVDRYWIMPPKIGRRIQVLPARMAGISNDATEEAAAWLKEFTTIHPEGSLFLLLGVTYSSLASSVPEERLRGIEFLEKSRIAFRQASNHNMFVNETRTHAQLGDLATSLYLSRIYRSEIESNTREFIRVSGQVDVHQIRALDRLKIVSLALLESGADDVAEPWVQRWCECVGDDPFDRFDALWHRGIVYSRRDRWLDLLDVCDAMLALDPESRTMNVDGFREVAVSKLQERLAAFRGETESTSDDVAENEAQ